MIDRRLLKNFDYPILLAVLFLILIGIMVIFSATTKQNVFQTYFIRQSYWFLASIVIFIIILSVNYEAFVRWAYIYYGLSIFSLLLVFFFPPVAGARRWLIFGSFLRIQPAELAKLGLIMALGRYLGKKQGKINNFKELCIPVIIVLIPVLLIFKQPDLGSALTFIPIFIGMLYINGLPSLYLFFLVSPLISFILFNWFYLWLFYMVIFGAVLWWINRNRVDSVIVLSINILCGILSPKLWSFLKGYQKRRLLAFLNPELDPLGSGYHLIQSKIAIGSGGFLGKGPMAGTQCRLDFLPAQHTDFIFSVIGEELGFIGSIFVILLFSFIILRGIDIAVKAKDIYGTLISVGILSVFTFHIIVNIGMTVGIMPITGVPLPFISYGGSSLMGFMIMMALLINIGMRRFD
ncbi:MAG: rod shape-determining protein RodA [Candidatus Firestonebacteria bacterium]|nr:rod shape-determining protein RodA [Candidatus Firestonebacteria bacterium]